MSLTGKQRREQERIKAQQRGLHSVPSGGQSTEEPPLRETLDHLIEAETKQRQELINRQAALEHDITVYQNELAELKTRITAVGYSIKRTQEIAAAMDREAGKPQQPEIPPAPQVPEPPKPEEKPEDAPAKS